MMLVDSPAAAQSTTGQISGRVTDPSGAVVASTEGQRAELDQAGFILSSNLKQQPPTSGIAEATLRAAQDELDAEVREDLSLKPH